MNVSSFLSKIAEIADSKPSYKLGHDGSDGTCDCIGLIIGAIRRAGGSWTGTHGSNYAARYEMRELLPVMDADELNVGDVVYKALAPGQSGYDLPSKYANDPDKNDYYHVGVVTSTSPLEITHCTGPGIVRDTKLGKWTYRGRLKKVDYDGTSQEVETMVQTATVVADSGSTVKMRSKPSTSDGLYWEVPVGASVQMVEISNGWAKVRYSDKTGYMMAKFLSIDAPTQGTEQITPGNNQGDTSGIISIQRAALQAIYDSLGSLLSNG